MPKLTKDEFKKQIVAAAQAIGKAKGFPWQLIAAQACLETGYGQSVPVDINSGKYSYNIFGLKGDDGPAGFVKCRTSEYFPIAMAKEMAAKGTATLTNDIRGGLVKVYLIDMFKAFHNFQEALDWYMQLMRNPRYAPVWRHMDDPVAAAREVQACGYATDPKYADKLIKIMRSEGWI